MKRRIYRDEQAVSPVIAVILMVAITVVLAAVLYVWAASFLQEEKSTPNGALSADKTGSNVYAVTVITINPQVSVNSVEYFLLDVSGNTKETGEVSEIYGYYPGQGKGIIFMDNDFNGKISPGDKFEVHPDEIDGTGGSVDDYKFRLKFKPTNNIIGYDTKLQ